VLWKKSHELLVRLRGIFFQDLLLIHGTTPCGAVASIGVPVAVHIFIRAVTPVSASITPVCFSLPGPVAIAPVAPIVTIGTAVIVTAIPLPVGVTVPSAPVIAIAVVGVIVTTAAN
jgi:hypothetical protein